MPIARYAIELMKERETLEENPDFNPVRKGIRHFAQCTKEEQAETESKKNPDYGESDLPLRKGDKSRDPSGNSQSIRRRYYDRCEIQDPIHDGTVSGGLLPDAY